MIPSVIDKFHQITGKNLVIIVTLRADEMDRLGMNNVRGVVNFGEVTLHDLPFLYLEADGVFFPSLLEVSSVTPLEGMLMNRHVFAARLPFNLSSCANHLNYFQADNAADAANVIAATLLEGGGIDLAAANEFVRKLPDANTRAKLVLDLVR
jgi:hypothetical protein